MSEWWSIVEFNRANIKNIDGSDLTPINTMTNGENSIAPPITKYTDYILRDEIGDAIQDENGEAITLEGLTWVGV